jgi:CBS domain containing-hemolysin-like protein
LVVSTLGRVPAEGDWLEFQGLKIEVVSADPRRVHRVRVVPPAPSAAAEERAD